jgi:hypothetical protein
VHGCGRGVRRRGSISRSKEERRGETMEGEDCRAKIGGIIARRMPARLLQQPCAIVAANLLGRAGYPGQAFSSYRDALFDGGAPPVGRDTSDAVGLNLNWHMRYQRSKQLRSLTSSPPPSPKPTVNPDEGWQVVKPRRVHRCAPLATPRSYSPRYLAAVEGK